MKIPNLIKLLILFLILNTHLYTLAQKNTSTIIVGKPENTASIAYLSRVDYLNPNNPEIIIDTILNNSFRFELDIDDTQLYRLYTDSDTLPAWTTTEFPKLLNSNGYYYFNCYGYYQELAEVFVQPGDSIHIEMLFDKRGKNISIYSGDRSKENKFLAKYRIKTNNTRGLWAYTFFGTGAYYKDRKPEIVVEKSEKERRKIQIELDKQNTLSKSFLLYLTNDNKASTIQVSSNVLNYIDSLNARLFFEDNNDFQTYQNLYTSEVDFPNPKSYERKLFVYMELMTTYALNLKKKQFRRYYELSEDKYFTAMNTLKKPLAELYGATVITQMINENYDEKLIERLISNYKSRFPGSEYVSTFSLE